MNTYCATRPPLRRARPDAPSMRRQEAGLHAARRQRQRGVAALSVILLLLFVLALVVGFASRSLLFEQRSSANQARSTQAFEAAEAGLAWAQTMLASGTPVGADCQPTAAPGDTSFRERFLGYDAASRRFDPRLWDNAGVATPLQAACVLDDGGWSCACPGDGHPVLAAPSAGDVHPAFALRFGAGPRSGTVQLFATGCDHFGPACLPGLAGPATGGASAQVQVTLALLPALATLPIAALTAAGDISAAGALTLANPGPAGSGLTAQAGGSVAMPLASLTTRPGMSESASLVADDVQLRGMDVERLFTRFLGLDRTRWQQVPDLRTLACPTDCTADLALAIGPDAAHPLVWVAGDLHLDGPATFGSTERPVLLVVGGQVRLSGGVTIHGAIFSLAPTWDTSGSSNAQIHGALVALGDVAGNGAPTINFDAEVLARLQGQVGTFARVPGSWRDF